jgi:tRNA A-37 threonylcarbamoyl transferase component Bud32
LYEWINITKHLTWKVLEEAPDATRAKWASQIRRTVSTLHGLNIIWGDVKARKVVIDQDDNAAVIDLEGGVNNGWIDQDKLGTREGDLQGLEKLVDYIINDKCPLRLRDKQLDQDEDMDSEC